MGDIADAAESIGIPGDVAGVLDTVGSLAGVVANVSGAFQAGVAVLQMFGVFAQQPTLQDLKNQLDAIQKKLDTIFLSLEDEILGVGHELVRADVSAKLADARTALQEALAYVQNESDPQQIAGFNDALSRSLAAVNALAPFGYWVQVSSPRVFYSDGWSGELEPAEAATSSLVFDYRYSLPAYQEALLDRIAILCAADSSYKTVVRTEVKQYADALAAIHNKIVGAYRLFREPTSFEFEGVLAGSDNDNFVYWPSTTGAANWGIPNPSEPPSVAAGWLYSGDARRDQQLAAIPGGGWLVVGRLYGVVDSYTGTANSQAFPISMLQEWNSETLARYLPGEIGSYEPPFVPRLYTQKDTVIAALPVKFKNGDGSAFGSAYSLFHAQFELGSIGSGFALYVSSGMSKLWKMVEQFYGMLGSPPPAVDGAAAYFSRLSVRAAQVPYGGATSLRQLCQSAQLPPAKYSLANLFVVHELFKGA